MNTTIIMVYMSSFSEDKFSKIFYFKLISGAFSISCWNYQCLTRRKILFLKTVKETVISLKALIYPAANTFHRHGASGVPKFQKSPKRKSILKSGYWGIKAKIDQTWLSSTPWRVGFKEVLTSKISLEIFRKEIFFIIPINPYRMGGISETRVRQGEKGEKRDFLFETFFNFFLGEMKKVNYFWVGVTRRAGELNFTGKNGIELGLSVITRLSRFSWQMGIFWNLARSFSFMRFRKWRL